MLLCARVLRVGAGSLMRRKCQTGLLRKWTCCTSVSPAPAKRYMSPLLCSTGQSTGLSGCLSLLSNVSSRHRARELDDYGRGRLSRRRFQRIVLLSGQTVVVAVCVHMEASVHQVIDIRLFESCCIVVVRCYFIRSLYMSVPGKGRSFAPCIGFVQLTAPLRKSNARTLLL